jgi:hypothetical protein
LESGRKANTAGISAQENVVKSNVYTISEKKNIGTKLFIIKMLEEANRVLKKCQETT